MDYKPGELKLIDQRSLPAQETWITCTDLESVALAIENMVIRGAPAIGCAAAYGLAISAHSSSAESWREFGIEFDLGVARLRRTRPTAVNLFYALDRFQHLASEFPDTLPIAKIRSDFEACAQTLADDDFKTCKRIGDHGAGLIPDGDVVNVLTHCNTGTLATAGYGTALGVIRSLFQQKKLGQVYVDETRPWLQGSRLTAYELTQDGIPFQLIADSTAAYLMQQKKIDIVVTGADRIAANGDTANKIGTYSLAVNAAHHGIPFYIAAPLTTFDTGTKNGTAIPVEERSADELRRFRSHQIAPTDAAVHNPSFDITPADLIAGLITEKGVLTTPYQRSIASFCTSPNGC